MKQIWVLSMLLASVAWAGSPKAVSNESEEEAMITEMENLGKTIQDAIKKIQEQFKGGAATGNSVDAKRNLEQLARDLESKKGQLKSGGGRAPGAVGGAGNQAETMKMIQEFMKGLTNKVMDNVNGTVDKLNKASEDSL